ncbi:MULTISPECIES: hypothetical protein [Actinomadura]|uniref:hypothetical protein n=1 Tax=Actinomadura sp. NPDC000929 TaxID=3154517 RepID=UPI0033959BC7
MADQALPLEFGERAERLGERAGPGAFGVAEPEVGARWAATTVLAGPTERTRTL